MNRLAIYSIVRSHPVVPVLKSGWSLSSGYLLIKSGSGVRRMTYPLPQLPLNPLRFHALR